jgi:hypothetical protein
MGGKPFLLTFASRDASMDHAYTFDDMNHGSLMSYI